jgi:AsmA-like protein
VRYLGRGRSNPATARPPRSYWGTRILWACLFLLALWVTILACKWPFTRKAVLTSLTQQSGRRVEIGSFRETFIPPGYVAENITLTKAGAKQDKSAITMRKLVIAAKFSDLFLMRKQIERASISGARVRIPPQPGTQSKERPSASGHQLRFAKIGVVELEDSTAIFPSWEGDPDPFTITVQSFWLKDVNGTSPAVFHTRFFISDPKATVRSEGQIGPWNWSDRGRTPVSGSFSIDQADLSVLGGIAGNLRGSGSFRGPLAHVACTGIAEVPEFRVNGGAHSEHLLSRFRASVNGLNGDTRLEKVESQLNSTVVESQGTIKSDVKRPGKTAALTFSVKSGHLEDFLLLFTREAKASMTGNITLDASVVVPPGPPGFLQKLMLNGDFEIADGRFTSFATQDRINRLSKSGEGMTKSEGKEDPSTVFSDLKGHVDAQSGTATFSNSVLTAPAERADIAGTFNLIDKKVDLLGLLRTTGKLSDTTSGFKTVFLKVLSPFWRHKSVTVVPFTISGTPQKPVFSLVLSKKRSL